MSSRKIFIRLVVMTGGIGIILVSFLAFQLGLDNNTAWGPRRIQMLGIGSVLVLFGALYWITPAISHWYENTTSPSLQKLKKVIQKIQAGLNRPSPISGPISKIKETTWYGWLSTHHINIWLILSGCIVLWMYIWIITIGRIEKWPSGRDYYWLLTQAFQQGQTHLLVEPDRELTELENPYDYHQRRGLNYLWDTTFYDGKYYLYWGPVPAVLGVLVSWITSKPVTDTGLVFSFVIGTAMFSVLLLKDVFKRFKSPGWVFWGGAFASMVNIPLIWMLTRPKFYEVSISGGQFFLMAGFYLLFLAFRQSPPHKGYLPASALTFGLAGATRINLLPSVIFLAVIILWRIYTVNNRKFSASVPLFTALIMPLALIGCSLLWYNYDRFGSVFEFGHRYQLTGPALSANYEDISSFTYIIPNFYTYVFRPPALSSDAPFFTVPRIKENMWPSFIRLPEHYYYTEPVAGILFIVPLIGFAALLMARLTWVAINGDIHRSDSTENMAASLFSWFGFSLFAYIFIQMFILLIFINSAMRYLLDVTPALIVLSTMFVAYYVHVIEKKSYLVKIFASMWVFASVLTVVFGLFIGITGERNNFLNQNPRLYYQLLEWFSR